MLSPRSPNQDLLAVWALPETEPCPVSQAPPDQFGDLPGGLLPSPEATTFAIANLLVCLL